MIYIYVYIYFRARRPATAASWAGRITIPEPFPLTNSMNIDNVHRHKCMQDIEAAKLRQAVEEEINLRHSFRGKFYFKMTVHTCVLFPIDMQLPDLLFL